MRQYGCFGIRKVKNIIRLGLEHLPGSCVNISTGLDNIIELFSTDVLRFQQVDQHACSLPSHRVLESFGMYISSHLSFGRAMPVQSRDGKHHARLQVDGKRHECPRRQSLAAAESDMEALEKARDASAGIASVVAMLRETKASRAENYIENYIEKTCGDKYRARLKRGERTYVGLRRTVRGEALQDAERLLAAAQISTPALQAEEKRLKEESGIKEESLEKAVSEAMRNEV